MCGPMEVMSLGKQCYFCVLVDDKTGYLWFHPCTSKSDFAPWFIKLDTLFMNHYHTRTKTLRSDHGGEYVNSILQKYCEEIGISMEFTIPHTPEQNGVAERANRRILDKGHTIMKDANAPDFLWANAFATAVYAINQTTSSCTGITPYESFFGRKPSVLHMRVWYADTFIHQPKDLGTQKLGECGHLVKFLGYPEDSTRYRTYNPHTHKVQIIHSPIFHEETHLPSITSFKTSASDSEGDIDQNMLHSIPKVSPGPTEAPAPPTQPPSEHLPTLHKSVMPQVTWTHLTMVPMGGERKPS